MITSDLVGAAALATVPVAGALGALALAQLVIVAVVQRAASVLHDAAAISLLPSLVDRSLIQRSNSRVGALFAIAATAGSHLGAALTALLGPARALIGDVASFLISAGCAVRIQTAEPAQAARPKARRLCEEIGEGLRYVRGVLTYTRSDSDGDLPETASAGHHAGRVAGAGRPVAGGDRGIRTARGRNALPSSRGLRNAQAEGAGIEPAFFVLFQVFPAAPRTRK